MDIQLAEQKIFALNEKITVEQARLRAMDKRTGLFTSGVNVLLQRVKPEEVELLAMQKRWEPFWNVVCTTHLVYDRTRKFNVPVTGPEVQSITLHETDYPAVNRSITFVTRGSVQRSVSKPWAFGPDAMRIRRAAVAAHPALACDRPGQHHASRLRRRVASLRTSG